MKNQRHWYLLAYDIRSKRRLQKLHRFLRTEAYAIQASVFAWYGHARELERFQQQIIRRIKTSEDDFRGYRLTPEQAIHLWGVSPFAQGVLDTGYPPHQHHPIDELPEGW